MIQLTIRILFHLGGYHYNMKTVSVIIPVYNGEQYIQSTVDAIFQQTYPIHEVIIVDDGSTDRTWSVVQKLIHTSTKIIFLKQKNAGPASARNTGIRQSTGEYIAFCDADDVWVPEKIEKQMKVFEHTNASLVFSGIRYIGLQTGELLPDNDVSVKKLFQKNYIPNSSVVLHRSIIDSVGLINESKIFFAVEDYQYWLRIATNHVIFGIPEPLVQYRVHPYQISNNPAVSYKKLSHLYVWFLLQWKYRKFWLICSMKFLENSFKYSAYSIYLLCKKITLQ
jgi:glycosyltransferase involved in cell wall biosynthesis